jgi:hypothetical protein
MHLWFTRRDLVEQVNKLLAEHYGEVIGDGRANDESDLFRHKTTPARRWGFFPTPVEVQPELADQLRAEGIYHRVVCADFLAMTPDPAQLYDRIIMNPPFDLERDVDHVVHALDFLASDGLLVAIMSAGTEFRETRKVTHFRALMNRLNARWRDLPAGSFASVGTYVNTLYVSAWKNGRRSY